MQGHGKAKYNEETTAFNIQSSYKSVPLFYLYSLFVVLILSENNVKTVWVCLTFFINIFFNFILGLTVVSVTYSAQWRFAKILPSKCDNISTRLDDLKEETVGIFANKCKEQCGIYATVHFTFSFLAYTVYIQCTCIFLNTYISLVWLYLYYQLILHIISLIHVDYTNV